jgi:eukaryotic-like serine/threonine-protein kinase
MSSCFNCDSPVAPEDRFCGNCGIALQASGGSTPAREDAPPQQDERPASGDSSSSRFAEAQSSERPGQGIVTGGGEDDTPAATPSDDYASGLQPTIIESSQGGGSAAAAARAHEHEEAFASDPSSLASDPSSPSSSLASDASSPSSSSFSASASSSLASEGSQPPASENLSASESLRPSSSESSPPAASERLSPASPNFHTADEDRRRTGDLPSRSSSPYIGRTGGSSRRSSSQLEPGTLLYSRYEIVKRIGGGGMGAVYYAKDKNLGDAPRAVKEMIQSHLDESQQEKAVADFRRESMLLASLEHPSIPTIYDYFYDETASRFYLVMKYISGGDCLARIRNAPGGRIDELTVSDWAAQVADVLEYLHNQRPPIIYRDLKPANLMIDGNSGRVMLIDFGIARWVAPQEKGVTAVGTMGYAPPELFSGKAEARTDIYGLGATMFHLLTGSDPQDNPLLIFDFTKNPTPRQINPAISNEMEWILMKAVEYEPERRFRAAADMRDTLIQHSERLRAGAVTYGVVRGAQASANMSTLAVERVFCGFCGKSISSEDVFCPHCGARQPIAAASASLRAARATARLVVTGTTELEATFLLNKEANLVGRTDPQSNIFPDIDLSKFDPETKISRRHARIWREGETFLVEDLGSVNGTVVNDSVRLGPRQPRPLASGDRLRLGETTLHFLVG